MNVENVVKNDIEVSGLSDQQYFSKIHYALKITLYQKEKHQYDK